jgi:hypothetical protein
VVRGGCFFSTKTLHCQAAGAVATLLVNNMMGEMSPYVPVVTLQET